MSRGAKIVLWIVGVFMVLGLVAWFVMFGPPNYAEKVAQPEFCARCHVMDPQYAAFKAGSHDFLDSCNDCHLPNDNFVEHWVWDGIVGVRDLVKYNLNIIPEHIEIKPRSREWVQENCVRCHGEVISDIHPPSERECWECHREAYHDLQLRGQPKNRNLFREDEQ